MATQDHASDSTGVLELIDQLEELLSGARRVPLSASVMVNEDEALELVDRARLALPQELVEARHTLEDRVRIVAEAEQEAERILARADAEGERLVREAADRAAQLVSEHAITDQARAHGETVVNEAEAQGAAIRSEADAYAHDVMVRLDEQLTRALTTVRKGIEALPAPGGPRPKRPRRG
jgi:regulator of protease activity HflC (stomatin/prohibitin superfamily)